MPIWHERIKIWDILHNDDLAFEQKRDGVVSKIRQSNWAEDNDEVIELLDELSEVHDADEYDSVIDLIYDIADRDRIWIGM